MRTKSIFMATTALALFASATQAQADGMYISVLGGLNWQPGSSGSQFTTDGTTSTFTEYNEDADTGFVLGGAIGTSLSNWAEGLRAEVEVSYRRNDRDGEWFTSADLGRFDGSATGNLSGNVSNFAIMANVWYDVNMGWKAVPYVGGGAGWARSHMDLLAVPTSVHDFAACQGPGPCASTDQERNGFAYQLGAGFNYPVANGVNVGLGYRYFNGPNFDPLFIGKNSLPVPIDNDNHSVAANLSIAIN